MDIDLVSSPDADELEPGAGATCSAETLASALRAVGVHARVIALGRASEGTAAAGADEPRARTVRLDGRDGARLERSLDRLWRLETPTLVHAIGRLAAAAVLGAAPRAVPVAVTLGPPGPVDEPRAHAGGDLELARRASLVIATSRAECRRLVDDPALANRRIAYLPPAVDVEHHREAAWRRRVGRRGDLVVGHVAVDRPHGGLGDLLRAVAIARGVQVRVADPTGRARAAIASSAGAAGVSDRVQVVASVDETFASCDAVVCCPRVEVAGSVALQAMASGLPVVATHIGGLADVVLHEATGLHVPPASPDALAASLQVLRDDPRHRHLLGLAARTHVRRHALDRVGLHASLAYARAEARSGAIDGAAPIPDERSTA